MNAQHFVRALIHVVLFVALHGDDPHLARNLAVYMLVDVLVDRLLALCGGAEG